MILIILTGILIIVLLFWVNLTNDDDRVFLSCALMGAAILFGALVIKKYDNREDNVKNYIQHPEKFKIEYKYEQKGDTLICTDTIVSFIKE